MNSWPQWQGPHRNGLNDESGLLQTWSQGGPKLLWMSRAGGEGYAGPAVVGGKLFTMGARGGEEFVIAIDTATGNELWTAKIAPQAKHGWGVGPQGTPSIDNGRVYALGSQGTLVCVAADDGSEFWRTSMHDFGGKDPKWKFAESPLVDGDFVLCTPGGERGAIVALDKQSGDLRWQTESLTDPAHYSSIIPAQIHGHQQYVQLLDKQLVGLSPANGAVLWQHPWPGSTATIPTPIASGDKVYATCGYGVGCALVRIGEENTATEVYANKTMKNKHGGVILLDGALFGHSDGIGWVCQDFETGKLVWRERGALEMGGIGYADGRFYCVGEDTGDVVLIDASTDGWNERGRFTLSPQTQQRQSKGKIWTHPVIVNGMLFLRDQELIYCYDVRADQD
ncbi:PQQ-binding-like beta-propeller repeat protein [Pirellulimonas nuda]|uniref:PQQ-binding-like beta-propeller repeat protein n=1 Tax=Pirellulimonas nuda TaxID=2528009 RepID=UPI0018D3DBAE|nr:PQQ-binding-like beta-propeller repeat protein [Pirellulimonas nuda]